MKLLDINWRDFWGDLEHWGRVTLEDRRLFLAGEAASCANAWARAQRQPFTRVMLALRANCVHDDPSRRGFDKYLKDHFSPNEHAALGGRGRNPFDGVLYRRVTSGQWLEAFAAAADRGWEQNHKAWGQRSYLQSDPVLIAARQLAVEFVNQVEPIPLSALPARFPGLAPQVLSAALLACVRYLLVFLSVRLDDLEPVAGGWPATEPRRTQPVELEAVPVVQEYHDAYLLDDMVAVLSAAAAAPLPIRSDGALYAKTVKSLEAAIATQPEWFEATFKTSKPVRIVYALSMLRALDLAADRFESGGQVLMAAPAGLQWLPRSPKDRLKFVFDRMREPGEDAAHSSLFLPADLSFSYGMREAPDCSREVAERFREAPPDRFITMASFLRRNSGSRNPLMTLLSSRIYSYYRPDEDTLEEAWTEILYSFLVHRLVALGGAKVGSRADRSICFALTAPGRYLTGAAPDFDFGRSEEAHIMVQPNFEVVFLTPAPAAEAEIARFSERKGRGVGVLFRIHKKSIFAAAAAGLTAESVLGTLRRASKLDPPLNVEREITGWFAQCRRVSVRPALLIKCPDAATAARVRAAARTKVTAISDTVLELESAREKAALLRKLRELGIFE